MNDSDVLASLTVIVALIGLMLLGLNKCGSDNRHYKILCTDSCHPVVARIINGKCHCAATTGWELKKLPKGDKKR